MEYPLVRKTRGADRYVAIVTDGKGTVTKEIELTEAEYKALGEKGAGAPPGVDKEDWTTGRAFAVGGLRNYGGGQHQLKAGEYAILTDKIELGLPRKDRLGRLETLEILKDKISMVTNARGVTITKAVADAWPDTAGIVSIDRDVLTVE